MKYKITLDKTVGIYGHDAKGNHWTTFQVIGGTTTCGECGATIDRGYQRRRKFGELLELCTSHVQIMGYNEEEGVYYE